jgi:hypothetical protein
MLHHLALINMYVYVNWTKECQELYYSCWFYGNSLLAILTTLHVHCSGL